MNSINDEVQKSLREIATLLLLLHEHYVQDPDDSYKVFNSLRKFIYDIGLKDVISSLDIENYRRKVMGNDITMNYEKFYDWLRGIASLAFEGGGKRALHSLLTTHIIPLASKGEVGTNDNTLSNLLQRISLKYVSNIFDIMLRYSDFLHLWFIMIISEESKRMTPINSLWKQTIQKTSSISISKLTQNFATCGIYPGLVSPNQLKLFIQSVEADDGKLKEELTSITFDIFLSILEMIAKNMASVQLLSSNPFDHDAIISNNMIKLIKIVSGSFLKSTLYKFWVQDHNQSINSSVSQEVQSSTRSLGNSSIAWLLRQCGFTQLKNENMDLLYLAKTIESLAEKESKYCDGIQLVKLPTVLYHLFKDKSLIPKENDFHFTGDNEDLEQISPEIGIIFAEYNAPVLYALPLQVPSLLEGLYCSFKSSDIIEYISIINNVSDAIIDDQIHDIPDNEIPILNLSAILNYFDKVKILPNTVSNSLILKTFEHTLGRDIDSMFAVGVSLSNADFTEFLFVLGQIVYGNNKDQVEENLEIKEPMAKFMKFLEHFSVSVYKHPIDSAMDIRPTNIKDICEDLEAMNISELSSKQETDCSTIERMNQASTSPGKKESVNSPSGSSFRDIIILLVHYPLNSFNHNPWQVVQMFKDSSKIAQSEGGPKNSLPHLFKLYCSQFKLLPETLGSFFSSFYKANEGNNEEKNVSIRDSVRLALASPVFDCLLNNYSLRLLYANSDLLKWEFSRWASRYRSTDPFTCYERTPILTTEMVQFRGRDAMMTNTSAIEWAVQVGGLTRDEALINLESCAVLMSTPNRYLTFSAFVIYALKCFSYRIVEDNGHMSSEEFVIIIKKMLQKISECLTMIQQTMHMRVLKLIVGSLNDPVREFVELNDRISLLKCAMNIYIENYIAKYPLQGGQLLPPRPPSLFWDVPRFVDFCKNCSVLLNTESIIFSWQAFGLHLSNLKLKVSMWGPDVVPPLPLQADPSILLTLLEKTIAISNKFKGIPPTFCQDNSSYNLQKILVQDVLPWAVSSLDYPSDLDVSSTKSFTLLEDIIRYGGENTMISIDENGLWLRRLFEALASQSNIVEKKSLVPLPTVCKLLSCQGLLRSSVVALQARQARHCRLRPQVHNLSNAAEHAAVTAFEFAEFEEIVIRCAYLTWDISNVTVNSFADPSIFMNAIDDHSPHIIETIREYCVLSSDVANTKTKNSWGVDFLKPYLAALKNSQIVRSLSICISTTPQRTKLKALDAELEIRNSPITTAEMADTMTNVHQAPEPIRNLVETPAVKARSTELLSDILLERLSYSIADPLTRNLNSVNLLASNSLDEINVQIIDFEPNMYDATKRSPEISKTSFAALEKPVRLGSKETTNRAKSIESDYNRNKTKSFNTEVIRAIDKLLFGTKEALWPVYATYCSCGDSSDPGKLSGPNLFTLLSKLGVLSDKTVLSDVGILLHQISAHTNSNLPLALAIVSEEIYESPSLSFEEFLIFLCSFSQLLYDGIVDAPMFDICKGYRPKRSESIDSIRSDSTYRSEIEEDNVSESWEQYMGKSSSFKSLLEDTILPLLNKYPLLAFPEDARQRDKYSPIFSLEVLLAVQSAEGILVPVFEKDRAKRFSTAIDNDDSEMTSLIAALKRIKLVPQIISESQVMRLVKDVMPERRMQSPKAQIGKHFSFDKTKGMLFPQWEYVLCIVANHAVDIAVRESPQHTDPLKIPSLIADVITSIAAAMKAVIND